jgi:hypothetical protein
MVVEHAPKIGPSAIIGPMRKGTTTTNKQEIQRILATGELREDLEPLEKAVKLVKDYNVGQRLAAEVCGVGRKAVRCALDAVKKGRPVGVVGRPRIFAMKEEGELVDAIDQAELKQKGLTFKQFQEKVCYLHIVFHGFPDTKVPSHPCIRLKTYT